MISNLLLDQIVSKLTFRSTNYDTFNRWMMDRIDEWEIIDFEDVKKIIYAVKDYPLGVYTFFPFLYKLLGVDARSYFLLMNKTVWKNEEMKRYVDDFQHFPFALSKNDIDVLKKHFFSLRKIRKELIENGMENVMEVNVLHGQLVVHPLLKEEWIDI